jgi:hypothetical protein
MSNIVGWSLDAVSLLGLLFWPPRLATDEVNGDIRILDKASCTVVWQLAEEYSIEEIQRAYPRLKRVHMEGVKPKLSR